MNRLSTLSQMQCLKLGHSSGNEQNCIRLILESIDSLATWRDFRCLDFGYVVIDLTEKDILWMMDHGPRLHSIFGAPRYSQSMILKNMGVDTFENYGSSHAIRE